MDIRLFNRTYTGLMAFMVGCISSPLIIHVSPTVNNYLLQLASLFGCSSVETRRQHKKLQGFDQTVGKLHDLSACEWGMTVGARCHNSTILETAVPE